MSPQRKRIYAMIIITVFSFIIVAGIGNFRAKQLAVNLAGDRVTQTVSSAADKLNIEKLQGLIRTFDEKDPYYQELREMLTTHTKEHGLENIYMLYKDDEEMQWYYVVDARGKDDPAHTPLGKAEKRVSAAVEKTIRGKAIEAEYHTTSLGTFVSSYQEIQDAQGTTFAVLAGDIEAGEMTGFLYTTRYAQIGIGGVALLLIGGIFLYSSKRNSGA